MKHLPIRECLWAVVVLVVAVVLYVLSLGPVVYLETSGQLPGNVEYWQAFYAPINWLVRNSSLEGPLDAYTDWWESLAR